MQLEYGKLITKESYHAGKLKNTEKWYQVPILVKDKSTALTEVLKALDLISDHTTQCLVLRIEADKDFKFKIITKEYEVMQ